MSLFLAKSLLTSNYELAAAETHVISIVKMDTGVGFNEAAPATIEGAACVEVTYNRSLNGPTCTRIDALVHNTGFTVAQDIVVIGVPSGTVLPDGTDVSAVAGITYRAGGAGAPFLSHICIAYDTGDCSGNGHWVDKQGGGTTSFPPDVILYHELSHAFHFATGAADSEPLAETDENDMRDVRNLPHRNTASHNGGCGGGPSTCCIVVSLATESPYSDEVRRLRYVREHTLRKSRVGDNFFNELHFRYYEFSPGVTGLMGHNPNLGSLVKKWFVQPLVESLEMLIYYADNKGEQLSDFFAQRSGMNAFSHLYERDFLQQLTIYLAVVTNLPALSELKELSRNHKNFPAFESLLKYINKKTLADDYIDWALAKPVRIWTKAAALHCAQPEKTDFNVTLGEQIAEWMGKVPISGVWEHLSRLETEMELNHLDQFMFDRRSREIFAGRLIKSGAQYTETVIRWKERKKGVSYA